MPAPSNTLLIEGTFEELAEELAQYFDALKKDESSSLQSEVASLLEGNKKEDTLKKLVGASTILNSAPERDFIAAYNLLIHLIRQAPNTSPYFARICQNLSQPITSSPSNGSGLALSVLSTIFNILQPDSEDRYHVFFAILRVIRSSVNFETLRPQLKHLDQWLAAWEIDEEDQRKIYLAIADVARDASEDTQSYEYLIRALRTIPSDESSSDEARTLSLRALKSALQAPTHFDFADLNALDSIQALRKSDPIYFELLEIFTSENLDEYNDFKDEHDGFIENNQLDNDALNRKMRLLTLTTLAAQAGQSRSLPYSVISKALQIPTEDVEMWVIDVIRAGLVEGKLSQLNQTFLIHRSTYRVFGENQWREVASRLDMWRTSLVGVLQVVRLEKENFIAAKEQEAREAEAKLNGGGYRGRGNRQAGQGGPVQEVSFE